MLVSRTSTLQDVLHISMPLIHSILLGNLHLPNILHSYKSEHIQFQIQNVTIWPFPISKSFWYFVQLYHCISCLHFLQIQLLSLISYVWGPHQNAITVLTSLLRYLNNLQWSLTTIFYFKNIFHFLLCVSVVSHLKLINLQMHRPRNCTGMQIKGLINITNLIHDSQ